MTPGISSVVSGLNARWAQQALIAENISGAGAVGHKRQVVAFGAFDQTLQQAQGNLFSAPLTYAQPDSFDWTAGRLQKTDQPLDAAISGPGFFAVQTPDGVRLTRNGHFSIDSQHNLINDAGLPVLGKSGPVRLSAGKASIQANGSIMVDGREADKLQVVEPASVSELKAEDGSFFSAPATKPVKDVKLAVGALETSNADLPKEMAGMIQNQRMYDLLTRAFQTQDEGLARAIQDLSTA
jgi:flagellar basal-body rod protein FlgF